jgi:hypothetical protein
MFAFLDHLLFCCIIAWQSGAVEPQILIAIGAMVLVPETEDVAFTQSLVTAKNREKPSLTKFMRECCNPGLIGAIVPGFVLMQTQSHLRSRRPYRPIFWDEANDGGGTVCVWSRAGGF